MLVVDIGDGDTDHLKFMTLGAEVVEELANVTKFQTFHVKERLIEVGFGIFTFGHELLFDHVPSLVLGCCTHLYI